MADYSATLRIPRTVRCSSREMGDHGLTGHRLLLEVNPRFNLWHYPGALGGISLPALVHALGRPAGAPDAHAPGGVTWSSAHDLKAAREEGLGVWQRLRRAMACDAISGFAWDDPFPLPRAAPWRARNRLRRRVPA